MKKRLALALALFLAACSNPPPPQPLTLDYSSLGKIYLDAQDVRIIDHSKVPPHWTPYVGHLFKPTLAEAVNKMAADRLQAAGRMGHATLIIKEATVTEQPLTTSSDTFSTLFERQQASRYIGRVEVSLEAQSPDGSMGVANAYATHSATLPENPTNDEKYEAYKLLVTEMMARLNKNLDDAIRQHMSSFLLTGPSSEAAGPSPTRDSLMPPLMDRR